MANDIFVDWHALEGKERMQLALNATGPFFVTGEDGIQLSALNSATGVTLTLAGRFMQLNGEITPFAHTLTPATDRTLSSATRQLGNGWILNFNVVATAGAPLIGQCWARVNVLRGDGGATTLLGTLVSGYVTAVQAIAFPGGKPRGTLDGPGAIRSILGTNPGAGGDWSELVPTGARWRLLAVKVVLTTSAAAANRFPTLRIEDPVNVVWTADSPRAVVASEGMNFVAGNGLPMTNSVLSVLEWALPTDILLLGGYQIRTVSTGLQAGDDWTAPVFLVEEWIEGA